MRARDRIMLAACIGWWLTMASLMPPTFPLLVIMLWWLATTGTTLALWRGYRHLTRPKPRPFLDPPPSIHLPPKYRIADDLTRHVDDVIAAAEQEAIAYGPKPPASVPRSRYWARAHDVG